VNEPIHPVLGKNPKFYSHKFQQAALLYELACSIYENKLVWMRGPFKASRHDIMQWQSQEEFQVFPLKVFRKHIEQEERLVKFYRYRDEKACKKRETKKKKHEKACK